MVAGWLSRPSATDSGGYAHMSVTDRLLANNAVYAQEFNGLSRYPRHWA
jgi:hypothetical protein